MLSPLDYPSARTGGAVNGDAAHLLAVDWLGWVCYFRMVIADLILATISNGAYYEGNSKNQNCRYPCD